MAIESKAENGTKSHHLYGLVQYEQVHGLLQNCGIQIGNALKIQQFCS